VLGTAFAPPNGPTFQIRINGGTGGCSALLGLGTYTENIQVASTTPGVAATQTLPFSLTITPGGVVTQFLPNFIFSTSTAPQSAAFTVAAQGSTSLNYNTTFAPPVNNNTPLPAANATILSGGSGIIPAFGTAVVNVQVSPTGLAKGVYGFCFAVASPTITTQFACSTVTVQDGLGFFSPPGGVLNISVPAGFGPGNLTQPAAAGIVVQGLSNNSVSPIPVATPLSANITFTPSLPGPAPNTLGSAFQLTSNNGANPCNTNAVTGVRCFYTATIDSTQLPAGFNSVGTVTFTSGTGGPTAALTVNLTVTQFPQVTWVNQNGAPITGITFSAPAHSTFTTCANNTFPAPGQPRVAVTGGQIPNVTGTSTPANTWLGLNGVQGTNGFVGGSGPVGFGTLTAGTALNVVNICVSAANLNPGTVNGTVAVNTGSGATNLPITFLVGPGTTISAKTNVGVLRTGTVPPLWIEDANGNLIFDGAGAGLDTVAIFTPPGGNLPGDQAVTGDWNGSGTTKIGIYRPSTGAWFLDFNGNGTYDGPLLDRQFQFGGLAGDVGVAGDWSGTGTTKIGIYRSGLWLLNFSGSGSGSDFVVVNYGGLSGDVPVVGDWTGSGTSKVGFVRAGFLWVTDNNGNGVFDPGDAVFAFGGLPGSCGTTTCTTDVPVVGDWNGTGVTKVGVYRLGFFWVETANPAVVGNTASPAILQAFPFGGVAGDVPVTGKWFMP